MKHWELQLSQNYIKLVRSNKLIDDMCKYLLAVQREISKHNKNLKNDQTRELSCSIKRKTLVPQ